MLAARNMPRTPALVPENDEMVLDAAGNLDPAKTNLYRAEVGQAPISPQRREVDSPSSYCQNMVNIQAPFLAANQAAFAGQPSPVPAVGKDLFTFLADRPLMSFADLGCQASASPNPSPSCSMGLQRPRRPPSTPPRSRRASSAGRARPAVPAVPAATRPRRRPCSSSGSGGRDRAASARAVTTTSLMDPSGDVGPRDRQRDRRQGAAYLLVPRPPGHAGLAHGQPRSRPAVTSAGNQ